jgi:hypothetical protein
MLLNCIMSWLITVDKFSPLGCGKKEFTNDATCPGVTLVAIMDAK